MEKEHTAFKEYVRQTLFVVAPLYHSYFTEKKYLVICPAFENRSYYIISSQDENFFHLTGLYTTLNKYTFYKCCEDQSLQLEDFEVSGTTKYGRNVNKKTVEAKLNVLPQLINIFSKDIYFQEDFEKHHVSCELALSEGSLTLGFIAKKYCIPKSLLNGDYIKLEKSSKPTLILSGPSGARDIFDTIVVGDIETIKQYKNIIRDMLADSLNEKLKDE